MSGRSCIYHDLNVQHSVATLLLHLPVHGMPVCRQDNSDLAPIRNSNCCLITVWCFVDFLAHISATSGEDSYLPLVRQNIQTSGPALHLYDLPSPISAHAGLARHIGSIRTTFHSMAS